MLRWTSVKEGGSFPRGIFLFIADSLRRLTKRGYTELLIGASNLEEVAAGSEKDAIQWILTLCFTLVQTHDCNID
uniref:Uncharacterized protein n=1 Tax=Kalanchoe fedtschenkoi TaxID=63787 RepID=A0A7N0T0K5_KALFE